MDVIKVLAGLTAVAGLVLSIAFLIYVFTWVFRILGFLIALVFVLCIIGYIGWCAIEEALSGRKDKGD